MKRQHPLRFACLLLFALGNLATPASAQHPKFSTREHLVCGTAGNARTAGWKEAIIVYPSIHRPRLVRYVSPVYPARAKELGIDGTVILRACIDRTGRVVQMQYVSGPPALVRATMHAVRQWRYRAVLARCKPVEFETVITVVYEIPQRAASTGKSKKKP